MPSYCVIGAGIMGRLMAWTLKKDGHEVCIFDRDLSGLQSCSWTGAGMLTPFCELDLAEGIICEMGIHSLSRWPEIIADLPEDVFFSKQGTIVVAHGNDRAELQRFERNISRKLQGYPGLPADAMSRIDQARIEALEPELGFKDALYVENEGQLSNRDIMQALARGLNEAGVSLIEQEIVDPKALLDDPNCDGVIDCRGLASGDEELRGVRGELLYLHAPEVTLKRLIRLMHPRYPLYIVPRPDNIYVVGATQIESDDQSPVSVKSMLELLSAAYTVHTGFAEARILESRVDCRPAYRDNLPRLRLQERYLEINGLFRHGFLLAPALADSCLKLLQGEKADFDLTGILEDQR